MTMRGFRPSGDRQRREREKRGKPEHVRRGQGKRKQERRPVHRPRHKPLH